MVHKNKITVEMGDPYGGDPISEGRRRGEGAGRVNQVDIRRMNCEY